METHKRTRNSTCDLCNNETDQLHESKILCKGHKVCFKCSKILLSIKSREYCLLKSCFKKAGESDELILNHSEITDSNNFCEADLSSTRKNNDSKLRSTATGKFIQMNKINAFTTAFTKVGNENENFFNKGPKVALYKMINGNNNSVTETLSSVSKISSNGQSIPKGFNKQKSKKFINCPKCGHFFEYQQGIIVHCESAFCKGRTEICVTCKKILELKDYTTHFRKRNNIDVCITTLLR